MTPAALLERLVERSAARGSLPVIVRPARSAAELDEVVALRARGYGRHDPSMAPTAPDAYDLQPNATVLIAVCKRTTAIVGTMRVVVSDGLHPLECEPFSPVPLAPYGRLAEAVRLVLAPSRDSPLVKFALWKAYMEIARHRRVDNMLVAARRPIDADYRSILFEALTPEPHWFAPGHGFEEPHCIMRLALEGLEARPGVAGHPLYRFCFEQAHAIDIRPLADDGINPLSRLATRDRTARRAESAAAGAGETAPAYGPLLPA